MIAPEWFSSVMAVAGKVKEFISKSALNSPGMWSLNTAGMWTGIGLIWFFTTWQVALGAYSMILFNNRALLATTPEKDGGK